MPLVAEAVREVVGAKRKSDFAGIAIFVVQQTEYAVDYVVGTFFRQHHVGIRVDIVVAAESLSCRAVFPECFESEIPSEHHYIVATILVEVEQWRIGACIVENVYVCQPPLFERFDELLQRGQPVEIIDDNRNVAAGGHLRRRQDFPKAVPTGQQCIFDGFNFHVGVI